MVRLSLAVAEASGGGVMPVGAVALSPITDLTLTGPSWETRAAADPYLTQTQALGFGSRLPGKRCPNRPAGLAIVWKPRRLAAETSSRG